MNEKRTNNLLDEMQMETQRQILKTGENLCFWSLLAAIVIQLLLGSGLRQVMGEIIVFALLSVYLLFASLKQGIWTERVAPTARNNALGSGIAAGGIGILSAVRAFALAKLPFSWGQFGVILLTMAGVFAVCFLLLEAFRRLHQKRRAALDEGDEEE